MDGVPSTFRLDPTTGLPAVGQYLAVIGQPPGPLFASGWVIANVGVSYSGTFAVSTISSSGFANAIGDNLTGEIFISDLGSQPTITPMNPDGTPKPNVASLKIANVGLINVSAGGFRFPLNTFITSFPLSLFTLSVPVFKLVKGQTYQLAFVMGPALRQDGNDICSVSLIELR